MPQKNILQSLDNGLILRAATADDEEALAQFNGKIHVDPGEEFVEHISLWTRDLLNGKHPTCGPSDFTVVEDTNSGEIVSTMCLIGQTWAYEGIEFPVGRPELVATHEDYRRRGLVSRQFEIIHQWSQERGHRMQYITGIPWYYRQFGYEMTVNHGGRRLGSIHSIPELKKDQEEPFQFRAATEEDIPFIMDVYALNNQRNLLTCVRDETLWRYELAGRTEKASLRIEIQIIETPGGGPAGYLFTIPVIWGGKVYITELELAEGISWFEAAPSVLRQAKVLGQGYAERDTTEEKPVEMTGFAFDLGEDHPIYHIIPGKMPLTLDPYAFFIRIPDLPGFLDLISPVLEERLAKSYMVGHTGELKLNFFKSGIQMVFKKGKIKAIEPWDHPKNEEASAHFPDLTFLQLILGHRDVSQLEDSFPDLYYPKEGSKYLLGALFPRKPSKVMDFG